MTFIPGAGSGNSGSGVGGYSTGMTPLPNLYVSAGQNVVLNGNETYDEIYVENGGTLSPAAGLKILRIRANRFIMLGSLSMDGKGDQAWVPLGGTQATQGQNAYSVYLQQNPGSTTLYFPNGDGGYAGGSHATQGGAATDGTPVGGLLAPASNSDGSAKPAGSLSQTGKGGIPNPAYDETTFGRMGQASQSGEAGGGMIDIAVGDMVVGTTGSITANGINGTNGVSLVAPYTFTGNYSGNVPGHGGTGGHGGGAGGTIKIRYKNTYVNNGIVAANGGRGGIGGPALTGTGTNTSPSGSAGGNGGAGGLGVKDIQRAA
jgi:hypothetical protein